jgi:nucleoside-diphosphate-sugar epimerase
LKLADSPAVPINITGPDVIPVRDIAGRFGKLFGKKPILINEEAPTAWLSNATRSHELFGPPSVSLDKMVKWIGAWLASDGSTFNKPTGFENRDGKF